MNSEADVDWVFGRFEERIMIGKDGGEDINYEGIIRASNTSSNPLVYFFPTITYTSGLKVWVSKAMLER